MFVSYIFATTAMPLPMLQISYSLANIENAAHQFWQYAHRYRTIAFSGELGAGKTTFINALCKHLGVEDTISSPTFAIINEYHFHKNGTEVIINHMDWYRIKDVEDAVNTGIEDILNQKDNYSLIEWPERARELLPYPHLWITMEETMEHERLLNIMLKGQPAG